jgi:hypothetical protein
MGDRTLLSTPAGDLAAAAVTPSERHQWDRRFFGCMALAALLTVFAGFARSYYLKDRFGAPPLTRLVHLHGLLFTSWVLLFVTQTSLIAARRVDLHRRLGLAGAILATLMLPVGFSVAVEAARLGRSPGPPPLVFMAIPMGSIATFAVLVAAGLILRRQKATHKRLMLLATITLLAPAIARLPFVGARPPVTTALTSVFVIACLAYDRILLGRIHPAFLWGGILLVLSFPLRVVVGNTGAWLSFAEWLTR